MSHETSGEVNRIAEKLRNLPEQKCLDLLSAMMRLRLMSAPMKDTGASPSEGELFEEIERLPEGDCLDLMRTVVESRFPINGTRTVLIRDKKGAVTGLRLEKVKVESSEDMDTIREEIKMLFASEKPKG